MFCASESDFEIQFLAVYILIHDLNLVNAPDLRTKLINCVVDIFWRGVAVHLDLYAS